MMLVKVFVFLVCCAAAASSGDARETPDTIRFVAEQIDYPDANITVFECMPEYVYYDLRAHQSLSVLFTVKTVARLVNTGCRVISTAKKYVPPNKQKLGYVDVTDVGSVSSDLACYFLTQQQYVAHCDARFKIGGVDASDTAPSSMIDLVINVERDLHRNPTMKKVHEVGFFDNTLLTLSCGRNDDIDMDATLIHRDKKGDIINKGKLNKWDVHYLLHETHNENEIACVSTDKETNSTWETSVTLKYRGKRGKKKATVDDQKESNQHETLPHEVSGGGAVGAPVSAAPGRALHSSASDGDDYTPVYDIVYEDRTRLQRSYLEMRQAEKRNWQRPAPPPVDTIPHREPRSSPPPFPAPAVRSPAGNSMIAPSDRYLLNLDSEGYEIPDPLRCIENIFKKRTNLHH